MSGLVKAIVSVGPGSFSLSRAVVDELNQRRPDLFYGPLNKQGFQLDALEPEERLLQRYWQAVVRNGKLYFLDPEEPRLRTDSLLVSKLEAESESALRGDFSSKLGLISLPEGVEWYVFVYEDGSEAICEKARMWRTPE